ncbi:MAG: ATP-binding protein [Acidobacteria bacterium]|nr:ATP-binding protein [Acidobacteriota bacterium]
MRRLRHQADRDAAPPGKNRSPAAAETFALTDAGANPPNAWQGEASPGNLASVREFVGEQCLRAGADPQACFDLKLAVDEACTNIVVHGFAGKPPGRMTVSFACEGGRMTVVIEDRGRPFDPDRIPAPDLEAPVEEREPGGLGWHLIRQTVDHFRYESDSAGNRLTLVKSARARQQS